MSDRPHIPSRAGLDVARQAAGRDAETLAVVAAPRWIDDLLDAALDDSFPASDPVSSLRFE